MTTGAKGEQRGAAVPGPRGSRLALAPVLDSAWERVFEQAPTGMWLSEPGPDGRFLRVNAAMCDLLGRTEAEVLAMTKRQVFRKEDEDDIVAATRALATHAVKDVVLDELIVRPDGTKRWLRGSARLLEEPSGPVALAQFVDVTELYESRARHEADLVFQRAVLATSPDVVSVHDVAPRRMLWASAGIQDLLGRSVEELQALEAAGRGEPFHPEDIPLVRTQFKEVEQADDGDVIERQLRARVPGRGWRIVQSRCTPFTRDATGAVRQALCTSRDVTVAVEAAEQRAQSEAFHRAVVDASPDCVLVVELRTGRTVWASRDALSLVGWTAEDLEVEGEDRRFELLVHEEDLREVHAAIESLTHAEDRDVVTTRYRVRHRDGSWRWFETRATPFTRDSSGTVVQVLTVLSDQTDVVVAQEMLEHAALHDPLTGLPNRLLAADRLRAALAAAERSGPVAVLFLDLDGFKRVNDAHGHEAGDAVLMEVARRLAHHVRPGDTVARVGGDEFVVVLTQRDGETLDAVAHDVADRLRASVAEPIRLGAIAHRVTTSMGLAFGSRAEEADTLLRDADTAMYRAKTGGKDRLAVFDPALHAEAVAWSDLERDLHAALLDDRVEVHFQPQVSSVTGEVVGQEALLRVLSARGDPLPAGDVVRVAEHTGLMGRLGSRVLELACRGAVHWSHPVAVSVNLSARELAEGSLRERIRRRLDAAGLPADRLVLELTESVLLQTGPAVLDDLRLLREDGVGIAIDDFGTGYASLRYLATLPVTCVKVDRSFTSRIEADRVSRTLVQATIGLARDLEISCVVEGVETEGQRRLIGAQSHVLLQGYLVGRASAEASFDMLGGFGTD